MSNRFIIDTDTPTKKQVIAALKRLKTTINVVDGGQYQQDRYYSQVWIETLKTETELENWLYNSSIPMLDYVGVVATDKEF